MSMMNTKLTSVAVIQNEAEEQHRMLIKLKQENTQLTTELKAKVAAYEELEKS